jgi:hypothetical protein
MDQENCTTYLHRGLETVEPRLIIALGNVRGSIAGA